MDFPGKKFFACACFSEEEDRRIGRCDGLDHIQYSSYAGAAADNLVDFRGRRSLTRKLMNQELSLAVVDTQLMYPSMLDRKVAGENSMDRGRWLKY